MFNRIVYAVKLSGMNLLSHAKKTKLKIALT